ncbi:sensor histidine kinase [Nesterenkonia halobia]|uniref:Sensor histidine kinase n=2 Tax=Nesterenkonia halobia TaxID=37922 RepID=A0ABP6RDH0_9MICC
MGGMRTDGQSSHDGTGSFHGVAYAGIWLVVLGLPVGSAFLRPVPPLLTALTVAATLLFIVTYLWLFWRLPDSHLVGARERRILLAGLFVLIGLIALAAPGAGSWSTAYTPFLAALLIFTLPLRLGLPLGVALWLIPSLVWALVAEEIWVLAGPGFGVLIIVFARLVEHNERRTRLVEDRLRSAAERDAIARDVHDVLGHSLTGLSIRTQLARRLIDTDPERARAELDTIDALSREALDQVRSTVSRLRTPELSGELATARRTLAAAGITAQIDVAEELRLEDPPEPGGPQEDEAERRRLFAWALREAVTNVVRHAQADRCRITVTSERVEIVDDGVGCPAPDVEAPGLAASSGGAGGTGLRGLRERAAAQGATVRLGPGDEATGTGTRVEVIAA